MVFTLPLRVVLRVWGKATTAATAAALAAVAAASVVAVGPRRVPPPRAQWRRMLFMLFMLFMQLARSTLDNP